MSVTSNLQLGITRKLPVILQTEAAECGLASLAMVAGFHRRATDPAELRRRFGFSLKGATLKDVITVADHIGLASRPLRLELDELHLLRTPAILHWDLNHFVVLKSVGRGHITIHDPADGVRRLPMAEVSRHFTGVALELTPTGGFEPAEAPPRIRLLALLGQITGLRRALGHLLMLALVIEVFALIAPLFLSMTIDNAIVSADRSLLVTLAMSFGLLLLLQTGVTALRGWMLITLGASLKVQARTNLFSHLLNLPATYFETRHVADIMSRFESQDTILQTLTRDLVVAILDGLTCVLTLVLMFVLAPMLALVALVGAVLYGLLRWASYAPLRQASSEAIIWQARRDSHFLESLRGMKTIKLMGGQNDRRARWLNLLIETVNRQLITQRLDLLFKTANMLLLGLLAIGIVYLAARMILSNTFSVGLLVAFLAYKDLFLRRVSGLIDTVVDLRMLGLHAERLADIALTAPEPRSDPRPAKPIAPVAIELRDVSFRYSPNDPLILRNISTRIDAGEWVSLVGPSGCGKTTLLKLMAGLLEPTEGRILIDGEPMARLGPERWRSMIGVVMQDDTLFAGSIADNIAFFAANPDQERIEECARLAAVHGDITAMPMGYGTLIGDMGTVLSGGQKQRILLARAIYRAPGLLLLDEATSHLDVARETAVNTALARLAPTRIVIAHRPETIRASRRIITLGQGRIQHDQIQERPQAHDDPPENHQLPDSGHHDAAQRGGRDMALR
ncbi:peptidase domain-containing ABC transporter [Paracoccus laeviglucosivorans]|uniref:Colicin V processing peptidase. Cysteine peptidase. MEROPS family C39 n=1 Tax=Paracoccus laeviglucosivorans TaxID=1197861 RepID=A0A521EQ60_9RHOB|nr:peptidase domain-containing ABC transporter [Paracoccus laeviglucosivorans]SMO86058.1 colicin V processing peptidase. Cysteine peptidase. MEROPS family C39 [Paracoccus laeviglucosivorans]